MDGPPMGLTLESLMLNVNQLIYIMIRVTVLGENFTSYRKF